MRKLTRMLRKVSLKMKKVVRKMMNPQIVMTKMVCLTTIDHPRKNLVKKLNH